jgi:outer membrane protein
MNATLIFAAVACLQDSGRLTLTDAVDRALRTHPTVASARAQRDRAAAEVGEATATRSPRVSLDAAVNQFQLPMVVAPLHGFDPRNPPLFDRTLVQSGLTAAWTAFDFGARSAYIRAEHALEDAAGESLASAEQDMVQRTVSAYLDVLTAREMLVAQDQRLGALEAESRRVGQLLASGKAARVEGLRVDAEVQRAQADRIGGAARLDDAEHALAQLVDRPFESMRGLALPELRLADSTLAGPRTDTLTTSLQNRARLTNPQLHALEQRVRAAQAAVTAQRATGMPEIRLSSSFVDRGRARGDFAAEWQVGLAVSYAVYGGGSHESTVRKTGADERIASEQLRLARLDVNRGVDRALSALRETHARVAALQSAVQQLAEVSRIERLSLDVGSGTQSDFLAAEANLLGARASLIQAQHAEIAARVELARILGELSREWLARTVESTP